MNIELFNDSYRAWFIRETKELMMEITVYLQINFTYNPARSTYVSSVHRLDLFEVPTDEEFLDDTTRHNI